MASNVLVKPNARGLLLLPINLLLVTWIWYQPDIAMNIFTKVNIMNVSITSTVNLADHPVLIVVNQFQDVLVDLPVIN